MTGDNWIFEILKFLKRVQKNSLIKSVIEIWG